MRRILLFSAAVVLVLQMGCNKDTDRPADLPKLFPVSITVTQEGKPLEKATVTMSAKTPDKYGTCMGETDASGVAVMYTYGFKGAPLGQYVVSIEKRVVEGAKEVKIEPEGIIDHVGGKVYNYVDKKYMGADSPHGIEVTEKGAQETFEVGAPVHVFLMDVSG